MRVLWLVNLPLPEVSILMQQEPLPFGGWLVNLAESLSKTDEIHLSVAFPTKLSARSEEISGERIAYFSFPYINIHDRKKIQDNNYLRDILTSSKPDIVHIFGTEYSHTLSMVNLCNKLNVKSIISIQGLVSIYAHHYMASVPVNIQSAFTIRDLLKQGNLNQQQVSFYKRGELEVEALKKINHVIGRTTWDKACVMQINPKLEYHSCNETLRSSFYSSKWNLNECEKHSIFMSQGAYPIKGLHFMIEAMPLILSKNPDAKLYIGGMDITRANTIKDKIKITSYGKYIRKIIHDKQLQDKVIFTGLLNETEMCNRHLKSHVFVCPSSIENSPNSLGEAMILGVPSVASYVGGVSDLLNDKQEGFLYQADAPYMLAHYICEIFADNDLALKFSSNAREHALKTHNREYNLKTLTQIYNNIVESN